MFIEIRYGSTLLERCYINKNFLNKPVRVYRVFWADLTNAGKLSRANVIAIARCDAFEMNTWEGVVSRSRLFTTGTKPCQ